jgi:hypothetical protein
MREQVTGTSKVDLPQDVGDAQRCQSERAKGLQST